MCPPPSGSRGSRGSHSRQLRSFERLEKRLEIQAASQALECPCCGNSELDIDGCCDECGWDPHDDLL